MTAYAKYTAVGIPRYNFNERHVAAAAALTPGDFYTQADGLIGHFAGQESAALADPVVFNMSGIFDVLCAATTDVYAAGAAVYFDTVNKYAATAGSATCLYMGTAVLAKVTGSSYATINLNGNIAPSLAAAATATTLAVGNTTITGNLTVSGTTALTGVTTLTGNSALKCGATVTAAGANQGAATALNEGDQVLVTCVTGQTGYGVKFPSASFAGKRVIVQNITAYAGRLYPYSTEDIGAGASTYVTIAASHAYLVVWSAAGVGRVWDLGAQIVS